jgi:hypothetical protein
MCISWLNAFFFFFSSFGGDKGIQFSEVGKHCLFNGTNFAA